MRHLQIVWQSILTSLILCATGCGTFVADRMVQAPNTFPKWVAPKARVMLGFSPKFLSGFPVKYVEVGPPAAKLCYRIVEPADYQMEESWSNWMEGGKERFTFNFTATIPGRTNNWSSAPRGTVVLLHGYGLAQFAMAPWAIRLAEEGWRCVLVDLRGHGKSTGRRIFYGLRETTDLSQLLDKLETDGQIAGSISVMGESYGGALALRWKTLESRVSNVVAVAPYAVLSNATLNISHEYAGWSPRWLTDIFLNAGLRRLPEVLQVEPEELDTLTVMARYPIPALLVAAADDRIMPMADIEKLKALAKPESKLIIEANAEHETVPYFFKSLLPPVMEWLERPLAGHAQSVAPPPKGG